MSVVQHSISSGIPRVCNGSTGSPVLHTCSSDGTCWGGQEKVGYPSIEPGGFETQSVATPAGCPVITCDSEYPTSDPIPAPFSPSPCNPCQGF